MMENTIVSAARQELSSLLRLLLSVAMPVAIVVGLLGAAWIIARSLTKEKTEHSPLLNFLNRSQIGGIAILVMVYLAGWGVLHQALPNAREAFDRQESAESTVNAEIEAEEFHQYGPTVSILAEKTYTRTMMLPPDFVQRIGTDGVGILAPYLTDPTTENITKLLDTFRRSGENVVFTREVTRIDETPVALDQSKIQVQVREASSRAYEINFKATFEFHNPSSELATVRFTFPVSQYGSMITNLKVQVGNEDVAEPDEKSGMHEWKQQLAPGESRKATIQFVKNGSGRFTYDIGSTRRKVRQFELTLDTKLPVRFVRGSIVPTSTEGSITKWSIPDALSAQQISLDFPAETVRRETYFQALGALPASFAIFSILLLIGRQLLWPSLSFYRLSAAIGAFAIAIFSSVIFQSYVGHVGGILIASLLAVVSTLLVLGRGPVIVTVAASLIPIAFLSPTHTGLCLLILAAGLVFYAHSAYRKLSVASKES